MNLSSKYTLDIISSCTGPHPILPKIPSTGDETLLLGLQALDAADYIHAVTLINEAIEQGVSWDAGRAEALNLRGTFKYASFSSLIQYPYSSSHFVGS